MKYHNPLEFLVGKLAGFFRSKYVRLAFAIFLLLVVSASLHANPKVVPTPPAAPPVRDFCDCEIPNCKCGCADGLPCVCAIEARELRKPYALSWIADGWWFDARKGFWFKVPVPEPAPLAPAWYEQPRPSFRVPQTFQQFHPAPMSQGFGGGSANGRRSC